eukprot:7405786-Alexandrium_andersonii.AAC.1
MPFLGPRSSRFERLKIFCSSRRADCGLRRIGALTSLGRIADCTLGTRRCKDASPRHAQSFQQTARALRSSAELCRTLHGPVPTIRVGRLQTALDIDHAGNICACSGAALRLQAAAQAAACPRALRRPPALCGALRNSPRLSANHSSRPPADRSRNRARLQVARARPQPCACKLQQASRCKLQRKLQC